MASRAGRHVAVLLGASLAAACAREAPPDDGIVVVTLDEFLAAHADPPPGAEDFAVRVALSPESGAAVHVTAFPFAADGDGYRGEVAAAPEGGPIRRGDIVHFTAAAIRDGEWSAGDTVHRLGGECAGVPFGTEAEAADGTRPCL